MNPMRRRGFSSFDLACSSVRAVEMASSNLIDFVFVSFPKIHFSKYQKYVRMDIKVSPHNAYAARRGLSYIKGENDYLVNPLDSFTKPTILSISAPLGTCSMIFSVASSRL